MHDQPAPVATRAPAVRLAGDRRRARPRRRRVARPADAAVHGIDGAGRTAQQGNAAGADAVQSGVEDLRQAEQLLQSGDRQAERGTGLGRAGAADRRGRRRSTGTCRSSIRRSPKAATALQKEPQNVAARNSLFDALQRKISLLQDTITLMNEMRKGNAAGVAQVVEGTQQIMMRRLLIVLTLVACACRHRRRRAGQDALAVDRARSTQPRRERGQSRQRRTDERETPDRAHHAQRQHRRQRRDRPREHRRRHRRHARQRHDGASIEAIKTARGATAEEAREMLALVPGRHHRARHARRSAHALSRRRRLRRNNRRNINVSVAYNVAAPEGTRIIVKSISGNISVRDIKGGAHARDRQRQRSASPTPGASVNGRSISGDIEIVDTKVEGALEAGTISGTVRLRRADRPEPRAQLGERQRGARGRHGRARRRRRPSAATSRSPATCSRTAATSSPRTPATSAWPSPRGTGFQVEATSFSGSINTDIPVTMSGGQTGRRSRALRGTAGDGGAVLDLTTFSGSIIIIKR